MMMKTERVGTVGVILSTVLCFCGTYSMPASDVAKMGECGNSKEKVLFFEQELSKLQICYNHFTDNFDRRSQNVDPQTTSVSIVEDICADYMEYTMCEEGFEASIRSCYTPEKQRDIQMTVAASKALFTEVCNQLRTHDLTVLAQSAQCMADKESLMLECFVESNATVSPQLIRRRRVSNRVNALLMSLKAGDEILETDYSPESCKTLKQVIQCANDILMECPNKEMPNIMAKAWEAFLNATTCTPTTGTTVQTLDVTTVEPLATTTVVSP